MAAEAVSAEATTQTALVLTAVGHRIRRRESARSALAIVTWRRRNWPGRKLREHERLPQPSPAAKQPRPEARARRRAACKSTSAPHPVARHRRTNSCDCLSAACVPQALPLRAGQPYAGERTGAQAQRMRAGRRHV